MIAKFTSAPLFVTGVVWRVNADDLLPDWDAEDDDVPDDVEAVLEKRFASVETLLRRRIMREYHNCPAPNILIQYGGWADGGSVPVSPRCDTLDDAIYEPFWDELESWTAYACECATEFFPLSRYRSQTGR
jgi:hypothetical protein